MGTGFNMSIVMSIPFTMLWGVQMRWRRKRLLLAFFRSSSSRWYLPSFVPPSSVRQRQLCLIVPGCTCGVRSRFPSVSRAHVRLYINLINNIIFLAIIVACLASFRNLFSSQPQSKRYEPPSGSNRWLQGSKSRSKLRQLIDTLASTSDDVHSTYQVRIECGNDNGSAAAHGHDSHDQIPLQKAVLVHVRSDVDLVHEPAQA